MKNLLQIFFFVLCISLISSSSMDLILLDKETYPDAQCLNGSQAGFYFQKGFGNGQDKYIVSFEGGGACLGPDKFTMLANCVSRSFTNLGSSDKWSSTMSGNGILQDDKEKNPNFYNWNKVFIKYCGGTCHQGFLAEPVKYLGSDLYFKGLTATLGVFDYLLQNTTFGKQSTTEVLLTGVSAGGLGAFYFADILAEKLDPNTKYWVAPDSGFFINYYGDTNNFMVRCMNELLNIVDQKYIIPQNCPDMGDDKSQYKCVLPFYFAQNIKSDLFIIMSEYDEFNLEVFVGIECIGGGTMQYCKEKQIKTMQSFREKMISEVTYVTEVKQNANCWLVSCIRHGFTEGNAVYNNGKYQVPMESGNTPQNALVQWMYASDTQKKNYVNNVQWPLNIPCNNIDYDDEILQ